MTWVALQGVMLAGRAADAAADGRRAERDARAKKIAERRGPSVEEEAIDSDSDMDAIWSRQTARQRGIAAA